MWKYALQWLMSSGTLQTVIEDTVTAILHKKAATVQPPVAAPVDPALVAAVIAALQQPPKGAN